MRRPICLPLLVWALLLPMLGARPGAARAAGRSVQAVVLETRTLGELRPEDRARVGDALWAALDRLGIRRAPDTDREAVLSGEQDLRACLDRDECLERLGRLLDSTHVIGVLLSRTAPTAFHLQVQLFDVDVGETGARIDWNCTGCGIEEVARHLDSLVESAVEKDHERPRATLVIRSVPPNVDVHIDGRKVGFTEMERPVFAGPHEIVLSRQNLASERTRVDVSGGQRVLLSFVLSPAGPPPPSSVEKPAVATTPGPAQGGTKGVGEKGPDQAPAPPEEGHRSRWKLGVGTTLLVAGVLTAGLGVASFVQNGRCTGTPCDMVYATQTPGIIEVGVGAAALIAGIALIGVDVHQANQQRQPETKADTKAEKKREQAVILPYAGPGGMGLLLAGRF